MIKMTSLSVALGAALSSFALELGMPFSDGSVLQCDKPVRVWGRTESGETVNVSFAGQKRLAIADAAGRWEATLTPMPADATLRELVAESKSGRIVIRDVAVGEVWLVEGSGDGAAAVNARYAQELREALGIPVGIVPSGRGGTAAAAWKSLAPYAARGMVWYRGNDDQRMHDSFDELRRVMKDPTLKLYFCQATPEGYSSTAAAEMLERQARFAMEEPNADMVVISDIDNPDASGLSRAEKAAKRLASFALHNDYGREDLKPWSPMPIGAVCERGNVVAVEFTCAEGLAVRRFGGESELDFEIAGEDGAFVPAKLLTVIDPATSKFRGMTLRFAADGVREPKKIRHRRRSPRSNVLVNGEGLPCGPFTMSVRPKGFDPIAWIKERLAAGASEVVLPPGRYRLDQNGGNHLELKGVTNVTIDCSGSFFWGGARKTLVMLVDCANVTIKNLTLDYPFNMPFSQGVIEKIGANGEWDVRVHEGYSDSIDWAWPVQAYDAKTRMLANPMRFLKGMTLTRLGPRRIRVAGGRNRKEKVGDVAVWSLAGAAGNAVHAVYLENCAGCRFENVTVYSTPQSNGFRDIRGDGGTVYRRCRVVPCPPEDDPVPRAQRRFRSGNHDAFNSRSLRRGGTYDFCEARNHCDDDVNINGGYWFISSVSGKVVRAMASDLYIRAFVCGPVQLMMPDGTVPVDTPEIVSFREVSAPTDAEREMLQERGLVFQLAHGINHAFEFVLAKPDGRFRPGAVFVSQNAGGNNFRISNCRFGPNRARALILNASYGSVENCVFDRLQSQAVRASSSYPWLEGGCSREVSVKGCVFYDTDCYFGANIGPGRMLPACSHRDIAICDNVFAGSSRVLVHGCTGLAISNNVFDCAPDRAIELKNTKDVRLSSEATPVQVAAIYRPHAVFKDLKSQIRPRFGNDFDGRNPETLSAEAKLAASAGIDVFVFSGDPKDPTFVAAVEAFIKASDVGGMRFAVQCDASQRGDVPEAWFASPRYWRENGKPRIFDMSLKTLAVGPTANAFEKSLEGVSGLVVLDAWNDYGNGRMLLPDYHAGDACLRAIAKRYGRRPADRYTFAFGGGLKLRDVPRATFENLSYGPHDKHHLDLWLPKDVQGAVPLIAYVHGGGWTSGEIVDSGVPRVLEACLPKGIAVAAIGYRFIADANAEGLTPPVRAPYEDCMAAMRFLKDNAGRFGLDTSRFGMTGGSAGGCTILLLAVKDSNPLGLKAVWPGIAQTTLDPVLFTKWLPKLRYGANAFGMTHEELLRRHDEFKPLLDAWSPLALLEKADKSRLPMMSLSYQHYYPNGRHVGKGRDDSVHDAAFGYHFKEACDRLGIACELIAPGLPTKATPFDRGL